MDKLSATYPDLSFDDIPSEYLILLPLNKFDFEAVAKCEQMGFPTLKPIAPHLLTWLQDYNWPIAPKVAELLLLAGPLITDEVRTILEGKDDFWQYWVLQVLISKWENAWIEPIRPELERLSMLSDFPDVAEEAELLLQRIKG